MEAEEPLYGGDVTEGVVRVGNTVRRPQGPHSPTVHMVLRHLESVGFAGAPKVLGVDDKGREVLTFVTGEVAGRPWPSWVADADRATSVARLARELDDALELLGLPRDTPGDTAAMHEAPGRPGPEPSFLGHRDFTPENTVFRGEEAVAFIDFDLARPSTRIDEVANLLLWWGGWMPPEDREEVMQDVDAAGHGRLLVDAYGLAPAHREWLVPVSIAAAERSWYSMRDRARTHGGGWARMWDAGMGDRIKRRAAWLRQEQSRLHAAVTP
ncbi:aminoglycoside phosphotransferase family protein [Terrabacter aerolatus]|uniref:Phosphotransferase n=1 Tax=Terrabacter aerolatus TaxID=422442 RepID=A0A512D067_9MICO|nr:phosphotransferase [Terrabacter aerolatus]GEO29857.1 phosphotransferase [Terrabacter aerolatus]